MVFAEHYKDALLPPGQPIDMFKAKIVSMTPEVNPKEMVVAVFDGSIPDATLMLENALPGSMEVGSEIQFKGTVKAFSKEPFMLTFEIDPDTMGKIDGWTGVAPASAAKGKAAKSAPKGKAKGKGK